MESAVEHHIDHELKKNVVPSCYQFHANAAIGAQDSDVVELGETDPLYFIDFSRGVHSSPQ